VQVAGSRYYNPGLGRWASRDPIGEKGGTNLNAFCRGDAVSHFDPLGLRGKRRPCPRCCLEEPLSVELIGIKDGSSARIGFRIKAKFKTTGTDAQGDLCRDTCCEFKQSVKGQFMENGVVNGNFRLHSGGALLRSDIFQDDGYSRTYFPKHYPPTQPPGTFLGADDPGDGPLADGKDVTGTWFEFEGWIRDMCRGPFYNTQVGTKLSYGFRAEGKSPNIKVQLTGALSPAVGGN
jgi:uncharacterized protein RhaS with RHS repeats